MAEGQAGYVKALRFGALTKAYDPLIRFGLREGEWKRRLLAQAGMRAGQRVLDVGCGTGTLLVMAKEAESDIDAVGLDGDPEILERARRKAREADVEAVFDEGFSFDMPYPDRSFDRVLSSLMLHHLAPVDTRRTLAEAARVLKPGGELHVADWGRPSDPVMRGAFQIVRRLDGMEQTQSSAGGELPGMFEDAGLRSAVERDRLRTALGVVSLYSATS